jgi:peptide/nickel transport system substrate-binding protein
VPLWAALATLAACASLPAPTPVSPTAAPALTTAPTTAPAATSIPATAVPSPTTAATAAPAPTVAPTAATTAVPAATGVTVGQLAPTPAPIAAPTDMAPDQTLRVIGAYAPSGLQPLAAGGGDPDFMLEMTYMPAFYLDQDGQMLPGVCHYWDVAADGMKYTIKVDPRAKFSDGSKVTAADIKFSWEYLSWPSNKGWSSSYVVGPVVGYQDVIDEKSKEISGLVAKDDLTLEIALTKPFTPFIKQLATAWSGIIKKDAVQKGGNDWEKNPATRVNVGPFKIANWDVNAGGVDWVPDPNWWGEKPLLQKVTYRFTKDANTRSIQYDNNEMDAMMVYDAALIQGLKKAKPQELHLIPTGGGVFFYFKTTRKPMEDINVRRAFLKASDVGTIVNAVSQNAFTPSFGILTPNIAGYSNPKPFFDPNGAKQALASSTYKTAASLPPISIAVRTNARDYITIAEALQQEWKNILGVEVTITQYDQSADPALQNAQIFRASLGTLINDPSATVSYMGSKSYGLVKSWTQHDNPQLEEIITKADTLPITQQQQRIDLYQQAEKIIMDQAYYLPTTQVEYYFAVKPRVKNYASNNDYAIYTMPRVYLAMH